jgi:hypothetical protein
LVHLPNAGLASFPGSELTNLAQVDAYVWALAQIADIAGATIRISTVIATAQSTPCAEQLPPVGPPE